jgi:DNA-binding NarL/FixJ family response regulator
MSVDFPGLGGPPGVREIRKLNSSTRIIVLTSKVDEQEELEVLRAGARGYCGPLETEGLLKMIEKVQQGEVWAGRRTIGALLDEFFGEPPETLSPSEQTLTRSQIESLTFREREILRLLGEGASNKEMAAALNVAVSTIKAHLTKIFSKLGQPDRLRLALCAAAVRRDLM